MNCDTDCIFLHETDKVLNYGYYVMAQDPGTDPARRVWSSINVGTEIYVSQSAATAEWTVSDFDILVPQETGYRSLAN